MKFSHPGDLASEICVHLWFHQGRLFVQRPKKGLAGRPACDKEGSWWLCWQQCNHQQGPAPQASIKHVPQQRVEGKLFMHGQPPLQE